MYKSLYQQNLLTLSSRFLKFRQSFAPKIQQLIRNTIVDSQIPTDKKMQYHSYQSLLPSFITVSI